MNDYYKILEIEFGADSQIIKLAYRKLVYQYHPDRNKSAGATTKFIEVQEAYECLSDENRKANYDFLYERHFKAQQNSNNDFKQENKSENKSSEKEHYKKANTTNANSWYNKPKSWDSFSSWLKDLGCLDMGLFGIPFLLATGIVYGIYCLICFIAQKKKRVIVASILLFSVIITSYILHSKSVEKENALWENVKTTKNYQSYIDEYPKGRYVYEAKDLKDEYLWENVKETKNYQLYLDEYPTYGYAKGGYGNHSEEAKSLLEIEKQKQEELLRIEQERQKELLRIEQEKQEEFLWSTENSAWKVANERNTAYAFRKFLELYPNSKYKKQAIDAEVEAIFNNDHGSLPSMDRTSYGTGSRSTISVYNNTAYTLTLRYSGNASEILTISSRDRKSITLPNGNYRIAASVDAYNVGNFAGTENLSGGNYNVEYYIQTTTRRY